MESIGNILGASTGNRLPQALDSETKAIKAEYTPDEAKAAGIPWRKKPPQSEKCKYCGKMLHYLGVCIHNHIVIWHTMPQRCDCQKAIHYWQEYDANAERQRIATKEAEKSRLRQERINRLVGNSGIKKRFQSRTFEKFQVDDVNRRAYQTAKEYADNFPKYAETGEGIYFEGTYGTGKTHLAVAIALQLMQEGVTCICKTSIDMLSDIKHTFDSSKGSAENGYNKFTEKQILKAYKDADLLIIDDLGKEMCTEWTMATLYAILNDRYEAMKPTIITTNYNDKSLINRLTPKGGESTNMGAMMSRLKGSSSVISMVWDDFRLNEGLKHG